MKLHDVAVTPDGRRLLGVGTLLESSDGFLPSKSRAEKRIIGALSLAALLAQPLRFDSCRKYTTWRTRRWRGI